MIKIFFVVLFCHGLIGSSCNNNKSETRNLDFLDTAPNVFVDSVPDSLKYLIPILDTVLRTDQRYRSEKLYLKNLKEQNRLDSINTELISKIVDRYGWLGMRDVGFLGYSTINLVMTHAQLKTKLKYLPLMVEGVKRKKLFIGDYALFEDKLNAGLNRYQYYGTQILEYKSQKVPYPILNPDSLDIRRLNAKLGKMELYMRTSFRVEWNLEVYKNILPDLIVFRKVTDSLPIHYSFD